MDATSRPRYWKALRAVHRQLCIVPGWKSLIAPTILRAVAHAKHTGRNVVRSFFRVARIDRLIPTPVIPAEIAALAQANATQRRVTFGALLCNYNHAEFIGQAIESVVLQSRPPDEYLILDDGSTDNSIEIIERYAEKYPCIRLIRKEKNEGLTAGMNQLIRLATADFLHFGSADDYMEPGFVENAMTLAQAYPNVGIVSGDLYNRSEDGDTQFLIRIPHWTTGYIAPRRYLEEYLEVDDPACTLAPSTLFRREAVLEFGGWRTDVGNVWNVSFLLQCCALTYGMCYLAMPCYTWIYRAHGLTHIDNGDLMRSVESFINYLRVLRTPPFDELFGEKFARRWFAANVRLSTTVFLENTADRVIEECRSQAQAAPSQAMEVATAA